MSEVLSPKFISCTEQKYVTINVIKLFFLPLVFAFILFVALQYFGSLLTHGSFCVPNTEISNSIKSLLVTIE